MESQTSQLIEAGKKVTLKALLADFNSQDDEFIYDALFFASSEQFYKLIESNKIHEDLFCQYDDVQEERRCMHAECIAEFS